MNNPEWMENKAVKEILSYDSGYSLEIFLDLKWQQVVYNGFNGRGLWFINEKKNEIFVPGENILLQYVTFDCKIPEGTKRHCWERKK